MDLLRTLVLLTLLLLLRRVVFTIYEAFMILVWQPLILTRRFKKQGIYGPKYRFFYGNIRAIEKMKKESQLTILDLSSNDLFTRIYPHYQRWMSLYGETFLYWNGTEPRICISDPEIAKQVLSNKLGFFVKSKIRPELLKLIGMKGLVFVEGDDWARHRRILNPAFSIDRLKIMTKVMVDCTLKMLEEWRKQRSEEEEETEEMLMMKKEMYSEFRRLTADIIATAAFGSSYAEGIEVFRSQEELRNCCATAFTNIFIPETQYLPTPLNFRIWKIERKMKNSVKKIVDSRVKSKSGYGDDLLGIMLRSSESEKKLSIEEIIDECRTFFLAGHETTANLLTWTVMLLSLHRDWQEKLREEVFNECGKDKIPDSDTFSKLKLMNMVIMESLRLYGPVAFMSREATKDIKLSHIEIPKGTTVIISLLKMHTDKAIWGSDADKFNPMRFENGVSKAAKHPNAFLEFSIGPRACIGQNFAMIEAKTVLAMILQRFRLSLSSDYKHAPVDHLTVQPQFGLPVMLQPLED